MTDIIPELRHQALDAEKLSSPRPETLLLRSAADEIERLRAALEKIAFAPEGGSPGPSLRQCVVIARKALKGEA